MGNSLYITKQFKEESVLQVKINMSEGYDPAKSRVVEDALCDFVRAPISGELTDVPGIGKNAKSLLEDGDDDDSIENTFQLIGKFLMLKGNSEHTENRMIGCKEHCDAFWFWLKGKGVNAYRSGIVMAIAEKTNILIPGIYDASELQDHESDEDQDEDQDLDNFDNL